MAFLAGSLASSQKAVEFCSSGHGLFGESTKLASEGLLAIRHLATCPQGRSQALKDKGVILLGVRPLVARDPDDVFGVFQLHPSPCEQLPESG